MITLHNMFGWCDRVFQRFWCASGLVRQDADLAWVCWSEVEGKQVCALLHEGIRPEAYPVKGGNSTRSRECGHDPTLASTQDDVLNKGHSGTGRLLLPFHPGYQWLGSATCSHDQEGQAIPMDQRVSKGLQWCWMSLSRLDIMAFPTKNGDFILDTDASDEIIWRVLTQVQTGVERVITYSCSRPWGSLIGTSEQMIKMRWPHIYFKGLTHYYFICIHIYFKGLTHYYFICIQIYCKGLTLYYFICIHIYFKGLTHYYL